MMLRMHAMDCIAIHSVDDDECVFFTLQYEAIIMRVRQRVR
jgi:hypothetical protein